MVTQPTLSDVLIEAGFETSIAHRAAEAIERDLAGVAQQPDVDRRFDRIEVQLDVIENRITTQDRLFEVRFEAVDKEIASLNTRIDDFQASTEREFKAVHQRIDDFQTSIERSFADHKASIERSLAAMKESLETRFNAEITRIDSELAAIRSELASLRREQRITLWAVGLGFGIMLPLQGYILARLL